MHYIAWDGYLFSQPDSAFYFAQMEYDLAEATDNKKWMADALNTQGVTYYERSIYDQAINFYKQSLKIREVIGYKNGIAGSYGNMGNAFYQDGNFPESLNQYINSLEVYEEISNKKGIAYALINIGEVLIEQGNYSKAINYYMRSLKIREELGNKMGIADSYNKMGILYDMQKDYPKALEHFKSSLRLYEDVSFKEGMAYALNNLGYVYSDMGDNKKAMNYYSRSLKIKEDIKDNRGIANTLNNIGEIYNESENYVQALNYYMRSLKLREEISDKRGIASSLINIGSLSFNQGNYYEALDLGNKSLALTQEVGLVIETKEASALLYKIYKKTGHAHKALEMYKLHITMRDSISNEENTRALVQQEYKHKYEKEQAVADAKYQKEMNLSTEREKHQQLISYGAGGGLVLVLVFIFLIYNRFKKTQRQKLVIQQKNRHITESISYARCIQEASLTSMEYLDGILTEYFILYEPRDIVSGDFYWAYKIDNDKVMIAVCDCTGHGVPGAFMSMISTSLLNEIVIENSIIQVDQVLSHMRSRIIKALKQDKDKAEALDGLDMTLLLMDKNKKTIHFAGAGHTLYIARNENILEEKGNPYPVGYFFGRHKPYSSKEIALQKGDMLYMTSDGFTEQFGGKEDKMFGYAKFKKLISDSKDQPMETQREAFYRSFKNWRGAGRQIDDICVMGVRF